MAVKTIKRSVSLSRDAYKQTEIQAGKENRSFSQMLDTMAKYYLNKH